MMDLKEYCGGEREIQVFRELTKKYEEKIWEYWLTSGSNQNNNTLMTKGVKLMKSGKLDEALNLFIDLSKSDPELYNSIKFHNLEKSFDFGNKVLDFASGVTDLLSKFNEFNS